MNWSEAGPITPGTAYNSRIERSVICSVLLIPSTGIHPYERGNRHEFRARRDSFDSRQTDGCALADAPVDRVSRIGHAGATDRRGQLIEQLPDRACTKESSPIATDVDQWLGIEIMAAALTINAGEMAARQPLRV